MKKFLTVLIMLVSSSLPAETVNFCSQERAELSNKDGTGYYWDLLRAAYKIEGAEITHTAVPFIRCLSIVENKLVDGAVAAFRTSERIEKFTYPQSRLHFSNYGIILLKRTAKKKLARKFFDWAISIEGKKVIENFEINEHQGFFVKK